jgi:hypothetical protein
MFRYFVLIGMVLMTNCSAPESGAGSDEFPELRVGESFPDLRLPSAGSGGALSIADFAGERLVLHIWASW